MPFEASARKAMTLVRKAPEMEAISWIALTRLG